MRASSSRILAVLTVLAFLAGVTFPLAHWAVHGIPAPGRLPEERLAHTLPAAPRDLSALAAYARDFEDWFGDALGGRALLLRARSLEYAALFGLSATPIAVLGEDDWVFLWEGREYDMQRGALPFSAHELEAWVSALRARQAYCRARGAEYVFALAPDKTAIYPERHPYPCDALGPSRTDQLLAALAGDPVLLDLRPSVRRARDADGPDDHAFFPYGTHWTDRGTAPAMRAIGLHVRQWPRAARWLELADTDVVLGARQPGGDSWAARLYLGGYLEQLEPVVESLRGPNVTWDAAPNARYSAAATTDDATLPKVLFFQDSYGEAAQKFLARSSARFVAVWDYFQPDVVEAEKPDVVVEMFVERVLIRAPVENVPEQLASGRRAFEAGRPYFRLDLARDVSALASASGIEARLENGAITVRWTEPTALAVLPSGILREGAHAVVRLDLELSEPAHLNAHYKTSTSHAYTRTNAITRVLPAGRSEVFLDLGVPNIRGPLALRLSRPVPLVLYGLESRLVD
jgi:hypothetical protein